MKLRIKPTDDRPELKATDIEIGVHKAAKDRFDASHTAVLSRGLMAFIEAWGYQAETSRESIVACIHAAADFIESRTEA